MSESAPHCQNRIVIFACFGGALVAVFLPRSLGFNPSPVHVEFMTDNLELGQVFLSEYFCFPYQYLCTINRYIFMRHRRYVL